MLRTNLSTRPFYNERAVTLALAVLAVLVLAFTVLNVTRLVSLTGRVSSVGSAADRAEGSARDLRQRAAAARATVDQARLAAVAAAAREANTLIGRRVFSWTELFNQFESTLPPDVRIAAVRPTADEQGRLVITVAVVARSVDDVDAFIEALEGTHTFADLLSREERFNEEGLLQATLRGIYHPGAAPAPSAAEPDTAPSGGAR